MCRDDDHGGRRCPNDTSEARQERRVRAREGAKLRAELTDPAATAGTKLLTEERDDYRDMINTLGLQAFDEDSPRDAQSALGRRHEHPATLAHSKALTNAVSALYNYRQAQRQVGNIQNKLWHAALTPAEIEAEKAMMLLGDRVAELAKQHGAPEQREWDEVVSDWQQRHGESKAQLEEINQRMKVLSFARSRAVKLNDMLMYKDKTAQYNELVREYNAVVTGAETAASAAGNPAYQALIQRRAAAYRAALQEVGVEFATADELRYQMDKNRPKLARVLGEAVAHYPRMWATMSRTKDLQRGTLQVTQGSRGGYASQANRLIVSKADPRESIHELGHYMEHANPYIPEAERYFMNRRAGLLEAQQAGRAIPRRVQDRRANGAGYADNFTSAYVGRIYEHPRPFANTPHGAYEVLTVGMETIFIGSYGGGVGMGNYKADREHEKFVLGLLATTADI
jgi:hypothetical protein